MLLWIFGTLFAISLILLGYGYAYDAPAFKLVSLLFIFMLGLHLQGGSVALLSGENSTTTFTYSGGNLSSSTTTMQALETPITDSQSVWFGRWIAFLGALGFIISLFSLKSELKGGAE